MRPLLWKRRQAYDFSVVGTLRPGQQMRMYLKNWVHRGTQQALFMMTVQRAPVRLYNHTLVLHDLL